MTTTAYQRDLDKRALDHDCPNCGAETGKRCREQSSHFGTEKYGRPVRYRHVAPHPERVHVAWTETEQRPT
jgi:predicted RNA-binding Zn-ribbon protein involved in translation (DUF1610 family)